ncbi:MAG: HAD family hydrolase [Thermoplasmata archaeon]
MKIRAVLFDLHGTLAQLVDPVTDEQASEVLVAHGHEVYPQAIDAARRYVFFVDYPKHGYGTWEAYAGRVLDRLDVIPDEQTSREFVKLHAGARWSLYSDAGDVLARAKDEGLRTAVVTTIPEFMYREALEPVADKIDLIVDGYTFRCEKSNPRIYLQTLNALEVRAPEALMIGDEVGLDVALPTRLGMRAILLERPGKVSAKDEIQPDAVVKDLNGAMDVVSAWL